MCEKEELDYPICEHCGSEPLDDTRCKYCGRKEDIERGVVREIVVD